MRRINSFIQQDSIFMGFINNPKKETVRFLKSSYKLNDKDYTPIEICAFYGLMEPLEILFQSRTSFKKGSHIYLDAFYQAAINQQLEVINFLLSKIENRYIRNEAFNFLFKQNLTPVINYILSTFYKNLFFEDFGFELLLWSCKNNLNDHFNDFICSPDITEVANKNNNSALLAAMQVNNETMVQKLLLQDCVQETLRENDGFYILKQLLIFKNIFWFKQLINQFTLLFVKKLAHENNELLKCCVRNNDIETFEYLMAFEKPNKFFKKDLFTYLYDAVLLGCDSMACYLLKQKGVLQIAHNMDNIILIEAVQRNMHELVMELLNLPMVQKKISAQNFRVFTEACNSGQIETVSRLMELTGVLKHLYRCHQENNPINLAISNANLSLLKLFLKDQCLLKNAFIGQNNPLVLAAEKGSVEILNELFEQEILRADDYHLINKSKLIMFSAAINHSMEDVIIYLLQKPIFLQFFKDNYLRWFSDAVDKRLKKVLLAFEFIIQYQVYPYTFNMETLEGQVGEVIFRAPFKETAMQDLRNEEILGLTDLLMHYQHDIKSKELDSHLEDLKRKLTHFYHQAPLSIQIGDGRNIELSLEWENFQLLLMSERFSVETTQKLYTAYYHHTIHTAWRYLQQPNPWMSSDAEVVLDDPQSGGRYANFEKDKELLVCIWLASKDENFKPTEESKLTVAQREHVFFEGLASLNRSNNQFFHGQDSDGDKPSCPVGVRNLLIHSLVEHPLMVILTENYVQFEFYSFLNVFWRECLMNLSPFNVLELAVLWDKKVINLSDNTSELEIYQFYQWIDFFNITNQDKLRFLNEMEQSFGQKWHTALKLHTFVEKLCSLENTPYASFAEKFGTYFNNFLEQETAKIRQEEQGRRKYSGIMFPGSPSKGGQNLSRLMLNHP